MNTDQKQATRNQSSSKMQATRKQPNGQSKQRKSRLNQRFPNTIHENQATPSNTLATSKQHAFETQATATKYTSCKHSYWKAININSNATTTHVICKPHASSRKEIQAEKIQAASAISKRHHRHPIKAQHNASQIQEHAGESHATERTMKQW